MRHNYEDTHMWFGYGGEETVHDCACGESFVEQSECLEHIEAGQRAELLERARVIYYETYSGEGL